MSISSHCVYHDAHFVYALVHVVCTQDGRTELQLAARGGLLEAATMLIDVGADLEAKDEVSDRPNARVVAVLLVDQYACVWAVRGRAVTGIWHNGCVGARCLHLLRNYAGPVSWCLIQHV